MPDIHLVDRYFKAVENLGVKRTKKANEIIKTIVENVGNMAGKFNLEQSSSIIRMAEAVLTNDHRLDGDIRNVLRGI